MSNSDRLEHYGVKGMKWGKRNNRGSVTKSFTEKANNHEAKTKARDDGRKEAYKNATNNHEAKTKARDDGRKEAYKNATNKHEAKTKARDDGRKEAYKNATNKHEAKTKARDLKVKASISKSYKKTLTVINDHNLKSKINTLINANVDMAISKELD